jgi:hypothetical protein
VSASKPSSGPKQAPPVTRTLPKVAPPKFTPSSSRPSARIVGASGRNITSDVGRVRSGTYRVGGNSYHYYDPYGPHYYGYYGGGYNNTFYYLWLYSIMDDDQHNNPLPPEAQDGFISPIAPSYFGVAQSVVDGIK